MNKIIQGDCLEKLKELKDNSIDAVVTDPPYELGFMGKSWDNTGIANNIELWKEVFRVLKPGGHLLSFGGTRTYHRMACAIEDAGFEVRDMIEWCYGSGFPKSLNIGKAVDKLQGNEREIIGKNPNHRGDSQYKNEYTKGLGKDGNITKGTSEWEGWGTALKPSHEPICMARKPIAEKTVAENVLKYGTGGINIDESRVDYKGETPNVEGRGKHTRGEGYGFKELGDEIEANTTGRFPANLIHDNSEEVRECFPETKTGKAIRSNSGGKTFGGESVKPTMEDLGYEDNGGSASRFFKSIIYQAKASKSERNKGLDDFEEVRVSDGRKTEHHVPNLRTTPKQNFHPTVKPIALMEYLIKIVTPKGGTVLDPFAGSGTTLIAAKQNGFNYLGIELNPEYIKIANDRINSIPTTLF